jgi:hypothetical protein
LIERRRLIALFDDLTSLTARLISDKTSVEQRSRSAIRHGRPAGLTRQENVR